jgi:hypothetical protein
MEGASTLANMIYTKRRKKQQMPGGFFHLEDEKTKTRVFGYGHGDSIKLKDEYGNVWMGSAIRNVDNSIVYRFRDPKGNSLSGISSGGNVTLRDDRGNTWKGFID